MQLELIAKNKKAFSSSKSAEALNTAVVEERRAAAANEARVISGKKLLSDLQRERERLKVGTVLVLVVVVVVSIVAGLVIKNEVL